MVLELSPPGVAGAGKAGEGIADEALRVSEPFEGLRRGFEHGLVGEAWMRSDKRAQGLRDGAGDEAVRSGKLCVKLVLEPLLGCVMRTLRAVAIATGMMDAGGLATGGAVGEAGAVGA